MSLALLICAAEDAGAASLLEAGAISLDDAGAISLDDAGATSLEDIGAASLDEAISLDDGAASLLIAELASLLLGVVVVVATPAEPPSLAMTSVSSADASAWQAVMIACAWSPSPPTIVPLDTPPAAAPPPLD